MATALQTKLIITIVNYFTHPYQLNFLCFVLLATKKKLLPYQTVETWLKKQGRLNTEYYRYQYGMWSRWGSEWINVSFLVLHTRINGTSALPTELQSNNRGVIVYNQLYVCLKDAHSKHKDQTLIHTDSVWTVRWFCLYFYLLDFIYWNIASNFSHQFLWKTDVFKLLYNTIQ